MSVGVPVKLLHEAVEHVVTIELKTGELYRGTMIDSEHNWNCVKLLHEAVEHVVTIELKTGELHRGTMIDSEHNWNRVLQNVTFTTKGGQVSKLEHIFIRGSKIRLMVIPDMFKYSAVFKILEAKIKGKGSSIGVSRGRAVGMRAEGQAGCRGRGARPSRGGAPRLRR